jgi:hypothetical protein
VKKIFSTGALTLLIGLALSGCASTSTPDPLSGSGSGSTESPPPATKPLMDETQHSNLVAELKKIDPELGEQKNVAAAQPICRIILRGDPEEKQLDFAKKMIRKTSIQPGPPTDEAAKKVIDVIKTNGFCKDAS